MVKQKSYKDSKRFYRLKEYPFEKVIKIKIKGKTPYLSNKMVTKEYRKIMLEKQRGLKCYNYTNERRYKNTNES